MSKWQYKETSKGNSTRKNGMMLEHRYVISQKFGRPLTSSETVHHRDNDRTNNKIDNLMLFRSLGEHARFHMGGIAKLENDGTYSCEKSVPTQVCKQCGKLTENKKYCSYRCSAVGSRKVERPSREELKIAIQTKSWCTIGREFGVTDNAVRKWAKRYNIM